MDIFSIFLLGFVIGACVMGLPWLIVSKRHDGSIVISKTDAKQIFTIELDIEPEEIAKRESIVLVIRKEADLAN